MARIDVDTLIVTLTVGDLQNIIAKEVSKAMNPVCTPVSEILDIKGVADLTGYSIPTIYKFTSQRMIPFHKPAHGGRRLCFNRAEIADWMQTHTVQTTEQYCEEAMRLKIDCYRSHKSFGFANPQSRLNPTP